MSAYWVAHVTITDPVAYSAYQSLAPAAFAAHGARFLARGGTAEVLEGPALDRHVVIEFPTLAAARACYNSAEYRAACANREGACVAHIVIVDGLPPGCLQWSQLRRNMIGGSALRIDADTTRSQLEDQTQPLLGRAISSIFKEHEGRRAASGWGAESCLSPIETNLPTSGCSLHGPLRPQPTDNGGLD